MAKVVKPVGYTTRSRTVGIPSPRVSQLPGLGISKRRTGRGRYASVCNSSRNVVTHVRRTFATVASGSLDQVAVNSVMGHCAGQRDMESLFRQRIRRVDPQRRSLGAFFRDEVAAPLQADFYIGLLRFANSASDPECAFTAIRTAIETGGKSVDARMLKARDRAFEILEQRFIDHSDIDSSDDNGFAIFLFALIIFSSSYCYDRVSETQNALAFD